MSDTALRTALAAIAGTTAAVCTQLLASGAFGALGNGIISSVAIGVSTFAGAFSPSLLKSATGSTS